MPHLSFPETDAARPAKNSAEKTRREPNGSLPPSQPASPRIALNNYSVWWRLLATGLIFGTLAAGQIVNTNDWFPLGSLSQYSYGRPLDTPTRSIGVMAINEDGEEVRVSLTNSGSGIGRAEIEGQSQRIIDDPSLLEALARSWHGLHPDQPQYRELKMIRVTKYIKDGIPTGELDTELLATWTVSGNYERTAK